MAAIASGSASGSASERVLPVIKQMEVECGAIPAAQEELLAGAPFLGGNAEEAAQVFSTPPDQDQQSQPQQGQGEKGEDAIIDMCTQPFTQPPPSPASSSSSSSSESEKRRLSKPRKPRVCTRKVRASKIRAPAPSPSPSPSSPPSPDAYVHPLYKAFLAIPCAPLPPPDGDILELARKAGIF